MAEPNDVPVQKPPPPKRRWRPRFSLRTLLLAVLLVGSCALLWWNWGPWAPAFTIKQEVPIALAAFSPDGKILCTQTSKQKGKAGYDTDYRVALWSAENGRQLKSFIIRAKSVAEERVRFSPGGRYAFIASPVKNDMTRESVLRLWSVDSHKELLPGFIADSSLSSLKFSASDKFALASSYGRTRLLALPDWREVASFVGENVAFEPFAADEKSCLIHTAAERLVVAAETGEMDDALTAQLPPLAEMTGFTPSPLEDFRAPRLITSTLEYDSGKILARPGKAELFDCYSRRWRITEGSLAFLGFAESSGSFMTSVSFGGTPSDRVVVWKQTRPLEWSGAAWMPEFWVVVVLAVALFWSLYRDGKSISRKRGSRRVRYVKLAT